MDRRKPSETRRDFLGMAVWGMGATVVGSGLLTVLGATRAPSDPGRDLLRVDLSQLLIGEPQSFAFDQKPLTVWRRTPEQVAQSQDLDLASIRDPLARNSNLDLRETAEDKNRSYGDVIVVVAQCTRLGCVPNDQAGDFGGWLCACCASHYDLAGRIRKGPAPRNLEIPNYAVDENFLTFYADGAGPISEEKLDRLLNG